MLLSAHIRERIAAAGGWISFADYMQMALYAPGLGYYSAGATKFGAAGDFVTAPELSPLFSQCIARQCAPVLQALPGSVVLEPGAGSGVMAAAMLAEFAELGVLPEEYLILETSADLRARQAAEIAQLPEVVAARVRWLDTLPAEPVRGVIVANEVADALPVRRFHYSAGVASELGVVATDAGFAAAPGAFDAAFAARLAELFAGQAPPAGDYESEFCEALPAWVEALTNTLDDGIVLLLDYGFSRREYYLPERSSGTLRCYYRHRAHDDPFLWPGLQDITAWVDFTAVAEAADAAGWEIAGYTTQAQFLLAGGIDALVEARSGQSAREQAAMAGVLRTLLLPGEMGDAIKVIALRRGAVPVPAGLAGRDMRAEL